MSPHENHYRLRSMLLHNECIAPPENDSKTNITRWQTEYINAVNDLEAQDRSCKQLLQQIQDANRVNVAAEQALRQRVEDLEREVGLCRERLAESNDLVQRLERVLECWGDDPPQRPPGEVDVDRLIMLMSC